METILLHRLGHLTVDAAQWILAFLDMQLQTESEQIGNLNLLVGSHLLGNIHLACSTDVIAEHQLSFPFRHIEESCQHHMLTDILSTLTFT